MGDARNGLARAHAVCGGRNARSRARETLVEHLGLRRLSGACGLRLPLLSRLEPRRCLCGYGTPDGTMVRLEFWRWIIRKLLFCHCLGDGGIPGLGEAPKVFRTRPMDYLDGPRLFLVYDFQRGGRLCPRPNAGARRGSLCGAGGLLVAPAPNQTRRLISSSRPGIPAEYIDRLPARP